jgi:hypothetical protein
MPAPEIVSPGSVVSEVRFVVRVGIVGYRGLTDRIAATKGWTPKQTQAKLVNELVTRLEHACTAIDLPFGARFTESFLATGDALLGFDTAKDADAFADEFLRRAAEERSKVTPTLARRQYQIVIHGDSRTKTAKLLMDLTRLAANPMPSSVVISSVVCDKLPAELRKKYRRRDAGLEGRPTFVRMAPLALGSAPRPRCFIVMPFAGRRNAEVLDLFIEPAIHEAGCDPQRSDWDRSLKITPQLLSSLQWDPKMIAYVGRPPWNANVMLEVGYRLAMQKPVVILREPKVKGEETLPFDLSDRRVVFLPRAGERDRKLIRSTIDQIRDLLAEEESTLGRVYPYPMATVRFRQVDGQGLLEYAESTPAADHLFQRDLEGITVQEFVSTITSLMSRPQYAAFETEQDQLIQQVHPMLFFKKPVPRATIPIVFTKAHPDRSLIGRAFLPIIVRVLPEGSGDFSLRVLYLDVTGGVKKEKDILVADLSQIRSAVPALPLGPRSRSQSRQPATDVR